MLAYHGSEDKQTQATVVMNRYAEKEGVKIEEFIGPGVGHKYEAETKKKIAERIDDLLKKERDKFPKAAQLVSYSLVNIGDASLFLITEMEREWERAEVSYTLGSDGKLEVRTSNVRSFRISRLEFAAPKISSVTINGESVPFTLGEREIAYYRGEARWKRDSESPWMKLAFPPLAKRVFVSGPIDDAFTSSFVFVKPTGTPLNTKLGEWTQRELAHATKQWRAIFRGDAQIQDSNLVLWGDPSSNAVLKKIAQLQGGSTAGLPVKWTKDGLEFGGKKYDAATHMPILIFPNPLNPHRYVVLNSGFTFSRACASGTNSLQTPKLPDWAIVDTTVPPDDKFPGKIVDAGFFDEQWRFTTVRPK